jgi:hypothetical protein
MRFATLALTVLVAFTPLATSHTFNHQDQHETCDVYGGPHGHFVGDDHPHEHDPEDPVTKARHDHDPCKQIRMDYPGYEDKAPLRQIDAHAYEIDPANVLFSDGDSNNTEVFVSGEAYQFPVPEGTFVKRGTLAITSDLQAAGLGLPGNGSFENPYRLENMIINGNLIIKDTNKCYVVRNNVVVGQKVGIAPILPDPLNILDLFNLTPVWNATIALAEQIRADYLNLSLDWEALRTTWDADKAVWVANKAAMDAQKNAYNNQTQQWQTRWTNFERDYVTAVKGTEEQAVQFAEWSALYLSVPEPSRGHQPFIDYAGHRVLNRTAMIPAFEAYQQDLDDDLSSEDVEGWIVGNPPPEEPPAGYWGDQSEWDFERQNHQAFMQDILWRINSYWTDLMANAPSQSEYDNFLANKSAFLAQHAAFMVDYNAFMANHANFMVDYNAFQVEYNQMLASTGANITAAQRNLRNAVNYTYEYVGQLGSFLFNTTQQLLNWTVKTLYGILDLLNPNNVAANTGQLILDWNGQCVHAYNNVVNDLRVNQNNDRTGYATGGIIEENRFFTIGQIRHYDGIFRENEVGNRAFLAQLHNASLIPNPLTARAINNDGANQGWYLNNVIYGQVDLDFHGHHHSAGFFAPTSHYHGSTRSIAYMQTTSGTCTATYASPNSTKNGPWVDYPTDNDIHVMGQVVVAQADNENCLPHFDHAKRWTSVLFNNNIVIDPNGVGLRFEDRDHRADDEQANSENMKELKRPHFHQKWVQMENNTVVGKIFIDVLNAAGTDLWSDNWAPVVSPAGTARTTEALAHPGAKIVNSHPYRNDAWLDIQGNDVFVTQSTGILVADADDMTLFQLKNNRGFALNSSLKPGLNTSGMLEWFAASKNLPTPEVVSKLAKWNGTDRGIQAFATLSFLRDHYTVQHCDNTARGLDRGLVALDRIYDNVDPETQGIRACGFSDWGNSTGVELAYTATPTTNPRCTEGLRSSTGDTDDFYVSELVFDQMDTSVPAAACQMIQAPPENTITVSVQPRLP